MSEQQDHEHTHEGDETFGMAIGFRIFEDEGELYMAEAEITPYVDDPDALGATLVFHALSGIDPTSPGDEEDEGGMWPVDIDDDLTRDEGAPVTEQFQAILRQLKELSERDLRDYLKAAREEAGIEEE